MKNAADKYRKVLHRELAMEIACIDLQLVRARVRGAEIGDLEYQAVALRDFWARLELPDLPDITAMVNAMMEVHPRPERVQRKPVAQLLEEEVAAWMVLVREALAGKEAGISAKELRAVGLEKDQILALVKGGQIVPEGQGPGRRYKLAEAVVQKDERQRALFEGAPADPGKQS